MLYCLYRDLMLCTSRFSFFDTYDRCFCVCVCACHPERNFVELNGSILSLDFKSTSAAHQAAVQHHRTSHRLIHGSASVPPLQLATPPGSQVYHIPKGNLVLCTNFVVVYICTLFSGSRWYFLALSAARHAGGPPVLHGASLGPGWAPWRVLRAFKVAKYGN